MKKIIVYILCVLSFQLWAGSNGLLNTENSPNVKLKNVDLDDVTWTDGFWAERFQVCSDVMVPHMWDILKDVDISHNWENFLIAAGIHTGEHDGPSWHDGDFYKWFEAAVTVYAITGDKEIERLMDELIPVIAKCQREDGYIHTPVIIQQRYHQTEVNEFADRLHFETYNMGHLMTAACVHYRVTGKKSLLEIAIRATDFLYDFYKNSTPELARNAICPSHYMGVVEMYRTTKEPRYLELAESLIEIRKYVENGTDHNQDRVPFRQQTKAQGHAVRANYLYAGVADVYAETGDETLLKTLDLIWHDMVNTKMYITGGCGALYDGVSPDGTSYSPPEIQQVHQAYGREFQLHNETAHNESCANIGNVLWNWRMLNATAEARFADVLELALYNSVLSSISLDGKGYFYTNPLRVDHRTPFELRWSREREPYISCFCCPPNVVRTVAEVNSYAYSISEKGVWVHLYGANTIDTELENGSEIRLVQKTDYPWDGKINISVEKVPTGPVSIMLRIPGWSTGAALQINGESVDTKTVPSSYTEITRQWKKGDRIELDFPMPAMLMQANPLVEETRNQVAVQRGPVVYCLESADLPKGVNVSDILLPEDVELVPNVKKIEEQTIVCLEGQALSVNEPEWNELYRPISDDAPDDLEICLVPYFAWGNRGKGDMSVWLPVNR